MRLFGNKPSEDDATSTPDPDTQVNEPGGGEEPFDPATHPRLAEEQLRASNLDDLYDADGSPLMELGDTGMACDAEGNIIPDRRPDFQPAAQEPPAREPVQFTSPFAQGILNAQEREAAEGIMDPTQLALVETMASRIADKMMQARDQSRQAARSLGFASEVVDEYAQKIAHAEQFIPPALRGTKDGAVFAAALAAGMEANESGVPLAEVMRKMSGGASVPHPPAPPRKPAGIPPSANTHFPNASPDSVSMAGRRRPERTIAGMTREQLDVAESLSSRNGVKI